ncbi:MAG: cytochrome ubiquinol oxidase subunit I [Shewanella sp.]|uniref:cytochrome ubiquinol oxidase subunit I n=1 Tax=Shewanella sp. TaxID=50422 RepID=UPI003562E22C
MFDFDATVLARIQFAFTISFHIIFPAITIGLATYLAVLEGLWLKTANQVYQQLYQFWSKIFAINFGMGVVSGIVMAYQFGTHWSAFSAFAGSVTGPLLTYEVLTAFFLEAGFLGVMLFGQQKVGKNLHFFATCMVATGTIISTFWILASNSWMQTPQGFEIVNNRVIPVDWFQIVFNPSFPYRLAHMTVAAFISSAFFVGASAAWHLLKGNDTPAIRKMLSMAMWMALIVAPLQAVIGDFHGLNTLEYQPVKVAAMEGHWRNEGDKPTPLILFAIPDMDAEKNHFSLEIPGLASLILKHDLSKQVPALTEYPAEDRPNVLLVFWSFRLMVGLGLLMIFAGLWSAYLRRKGSLYSNKHFLRFVLVLGPAGLLATLAGWFTTELGRQPWVIQGLMRTQDAVSSHSVTHLSISLGIFIVSYCGIFGVGYRYMMRLIRKGPDIAATSH